jgi:hypothetical protein
LEYLWGDFLFDHYTLHYPGTISHQDEVNFAARTPIIYPTLDGHFLTFMLAEFFNIYLSQWLTSFLPETQS